MLTLSELIYWPCRGVGLGAGAQISIRCLLILITHEQTHTHTHTRENTTTWRCEHSATHACAHTHTRQTKSFFLLPLISETVFFFYFYCLSMSLTQIRSPSHPPLECLACHRTFIINSCCFNINKYMKSFSQLRGNPLFIAAVMIY